MPQDPSFLLVLSNVAIFTFLYLMLRPFLRKRYSNIKVYFSYFFIFTFCMFSFWGADWFSYLYSYEILRVYDLQSHLEPIYLYLIDVTPSYMMFRLIIWGGALLFTYLTVRKLELNKYTALFCFVIVTLLWISYARVSLAMAILMFGSTFISSTDSKPKYKIFGAILVFSTIFLHKSSLFGIGALIMGYYGMSKKKRYYKILFLAFPVLLILATAWLSQYLSLQVEDDDMMQQSVEFGQKYLNQEKETSRGIGPMINKYLEWVPKYLVAYLCYKAVKSNWKMPKNITLTATTMFFMVYLSSLFMFDLGVNTNVVYSRFLRFTIIPEFIMLTYFYDRGFMPKLTKVTITLVTLSSFYALVYSLYNTIM